MRETLIQAAIMAVLNHRDSPCRVWRNNVGKTPTPCETCKRKLCQPCAARLARPVTYGLGVGSADLVGVEQVTITADMVGQTYARFFAVEVKTPTGRLSHEQECWLAAVKKMGGEVHVMRSSADAEAFLRSKRGE